MALRQTKPCTGNKIVDENGKIYESIRTLSDAIGVSRFRIAKFLGNEGRFFNEGHTYTLINPAVQNGASISEEKVVNNVETQNIAEVDPEYAEYLEKKKIEALPFEKFEIHFSPNKHSDKRRYAIALFSDAHIEETVDPKTVLGLNEYNIDIAKKRIETYFVNLVRCLNADNVEDLIFASLGDTITSYLRDDDLISNSLTPIEATLEAQSMLFGGLKFLCENAKNLKSIKFIGITGNHGRTTKKVNHSKGYALNYEWLMYKNVEKECAACGLPIEFYIPESEFALIDTEDNKRFLFAHGHQIKGGGSNSTVCGIYPSLNRLSMKLSDNFHQNKIFIGHFHSCINIPNAVVNGSIIGYNGFSMTNGFRYERPAQCYECYEYGGDVLLTRKIYCD